MAKILYLPEYGILPDTGKDCSKLLQEIFEGLERNGNGNGNEETIIRFAKGKYLIFDKVCIKDAKNLTIHGSFSTVVAHFSPTGELSENNDVFEFTNCSDVKMCDFFFDTDNPIGAAGRISAIDRENGTVDLRIYDEFPVSGFEHFCATNSFDESGSPDYALATYNGELETRKIVADDGNEKVRLVGADYEVTGEHTVRLKIGKISPKLRIGHAINIRYEIYGNSVMEFASCERVKLENITVYSAASFGVRVAPRSKDFTFENFCIRVPDNSRRLKAANADGIHILGLAGKLILKNCNMEGLGDDPLNIHGIAGGVERICRETGKMSIIRPFRGEKRSLPNMWADSGDRVYVYDSESFLRKGAFTVKSLDGDGNVSFCDAEGQISEGDTLANSEYFAAVHIDGCTLRNTRARGLLVQTHNVLIENSYISGMSLPAMLFAPDIQMWWEVAPCRNVEIRNNIIEHCAHIESEANGGAIIFKACHDGAGENYPMGVHENIHISGNRFLNIPTSGISVSSAKNVVIENNIFKNCGKHGETHGKSDYAIVAMNCDNIKVQGNESDRGEKFLLYTENCGFDKK